MVEIRKKMLVVGGAVTAVCLIILIVTLSVLLTKAKVCETDVCKKTAELLKSSMDEDVDPCDDFYRFACGNFEKKTKTSLMSGPFADAMLKMPTDLKELLRNHKFNGKKGSSTDKAAEFYQLCVKSDRKTREANSKLLRTLLTELMGGTPLVPKTLNSTAQHWSLKTQHWSQSLAKIMRYVNSNFILNLLTIPDPKNPSQLLIALAPENFQPFISGMETVIRPPSRADPLLKSSPDVRSQVKSIICYVNENCGSDRTLDNDIDTLIDKYINIRFQVSGSTDSVEPQKLTIKQLNQRITGVDWKTFFQTVFEGTSYHITDNTEVLTSVTVLRNSINKYFLSNTDRTASIILGWRLIETIGPFLDDNILGKLIPIPKEDACLMLTNHVLGFAVGNLYHSKYISTDIMNQTSNIIKDLKSAFTELLKENSWMDSQTRTKALTKVSSMTESVSAPDWVKDETALDRYYSKMEDLNGKTYQDAFRIVKRFAMEKKAELLKSPVDRKNFWPVETSAQVNAFHNPRGNAMMYPSGILLYPFFEQGRPTAMNYGSFGYVAGHEMTHGFDNQGRMFDDRGANVNWWSTSSSIQFENKAQCFVNQYGQIKERQTGYWVNGTRTLGENIADNGGIREAFRAFQNYQKIHNEKERLPGLTKYDPNQLFFLSAAYMYCTVSTDDYALTMLLTDIHSPNYLRATVPFQNSQDFSDTFECKTGDTMNPMLKCKIW